MIGDRRRAAWPRGETPAGSQVRVAAVRPNSAASYPAAVGFLSRPASNTPRWRVSIPQAQQGLPVRRPITMPGPVGAVPARVTSGWFDWKFGPDPRLPQRSIPSGGPAEYATGPNAFGVPAIGNIYLRPRYQPSPPTVGIRPGAPIRTGRPPAIMTATRRLSGLLPNVQNFYTPSRYGTDYEGTRGPAGRSFADTPSLAPAQVRVRGPLYGREIRRSVTR